jgi:hypothetical protein
VAEIYLNGRYLEHSRPRETRKQARTEAVAWAIAHLNGEVKERLSFSPNVQSEPRSQQKNT